MLDNQPALRYRDLFLRPINHSDIHTIRKWRNHRYNRRFFLSSDIITHHEQEAWYEDYNKKQNDMMWIIEHHCQLEPQVGQIALYNIDSDYSHAELGRLICLKDYRRKGFAEMACRCVIDFCTNDLALQRLHLKVLNNNKAGMALYMKLGFTVEYTSGTYSLMLLELPINI